MPSPLAHTIDEYTSVHAAERGLYYPTPVEGLTLMRAEAPVGPLHSVYEACLAIVAQGDKRIAVQGAALDYTAGEGLVIGVDAPIVSHVVGATAARPFLGFKLALDLDLLTEVATEVGPATLDADVRGVGVRVVGLTPEAENALARLVALIETPRAVAALRGPRLREAYYWLLSGPSGPAFARLALPGAPSRRIVEAVRLMKADFPAPLRVERLAEAAGMGRASFHAHFKAITGTSPLQYYKRLRLLEARRLLTTDADATARDVAYRVGYESPSQFSRDYARTFGVPPGRDVGRTGTA